MAKELDLFNFFSLTFKTPLDRSLTNVKDETEMENRIALFIFNLRHLAYAFITSAVFHQSHHHSNFFNMLPNSI